MRKIIGGIIAFAMILSLCGAFGAFAENDSENTKTFTPTIKVDEIELAFGENEAKPIYNPSDGRNVIPLRRVAEALDAAVYWFEEEQKIQLVTEDRTIVFSVNDDDTNKYIGVYEIVKNADGWQSEFIKDITLDDAVPYVDTENWTTYVPLRAAADLLLIDMNELKKPYITDISNFNILEWDESTYTVSIPKREYNIDGGYAQGTIKENETHELYLEAQDGNFKFTNIPDEENFWSYLLAVPDNNPVGTEVVITGYITDSNEIPLRRSVVSLRRVRPTVRLNSAYPIYMVKDPAKSYKEEGNSVDNGTQVPIGSMLYLTAANMEAANKIYDFTSNPESTKIERGNRYNSFIVDKKSITITVSLKSNNAETPRPTTYRDVIVMPSAAPTTEPASEATANPQPTETPATATSASAEPEASASPSASPEK